MIFQHTLDAVLSGKKTQTSRIWKPFYNMGDSQRVFGQMMSSRETAKFQALYAVTTSVRKLYEVGRNYAAQPARAKKQVARIEIVSLEKRDVTKFTDEDIAREGFNSHYEFLKLWQSMHSHYSAVVINFKLIQTSALQNVK